MIFNQLINITMNAKTPGLDALLKEREKISNREKKIEIVMNLFRMSNKWNSTEELAKAVVSELEKSEGIKSDAGLQETLAEFRTSLEAMIEHLKKNIAEKPVEYLDSTGKVIDQPDVVLMEKKHKKTYPAKLNDGIFIDMVGDRMTYDQAMKHYWVAQTGQRTACYRNDCVFNDHNGCTIQPMLTIGSDLSVTCGSEVIP